MWKKETLQRSESRYLRQAGADSEPQAELVLRRVSVGYVQCGMSCHGDWMWWFGVVDLQAIPLFYLAGNVCSPLLILTQTTCHWLLCVSRQLSETSGEVYVLCAGKLQQQHWKQLSSIALLSCTCWYKLRNQLNRLSCTVAKWAHHESQTHTQHFDPALWTLYCHIKSE